MNIQVEYMIETKLVSPLFLLSRSNKTLLKYHNYTYRYSTYYFPYKCFKYRYDVFFQRSYEQLDLRIVEANVLDKHVNKRDSTLDFQISSRKNP